MHVRDVISSRRPERLSALDATFLHVENDVSHMHLGSLGVYEGPAPTQAELLAVLESKLHLVPRYRQRVRTVPFAAARPVWVDDPTFDAEYHLRRTALPAPGGDAQLRRVVGRVMSMQLDRSRPLWELWVVEGLAGGRWALISKLHHSMVDGIAASSVTTALMDDRPDAPVPAPRPWTPAPPPGAAALLSEALADVARRPSAPIRAVAGAVRRPGASAAYGAAVVRGLAAYAGILRPPLATTLNGPIRRRRRWDHARASLRDVKEIRVAFGGTVNDVVLAAITHGFRALLEHRGEPTAATVRTLVPVSVRRPGDPETDNRVSAIFATLPTDIADPVQRLGAVARQLRHLKATHEPETGELLTSLANFVPEVLLALGGRVGAVTPQHNINTVTTNVPGPQYPLYFAGRRMVEVFPYVPIAGHVRVGVAIYSYNGALGFGVTADDDAAQDIDVLCRGIEEGIGALLAAARRRTARPAEAGSAMLASRRLDTG